MTRKATAQPKEQNVFQSIGPGIISAASDNDPTTVATLAVIGSTTIYGLSWLVLLIIPMLVVVQTISASVGAVCKVGLEAVVRKRFGPVWAFIMLLAVVAVNVITLAADIEGGAAALQLLFHQNWQWFVIPFAGGTALLLVFGNYESLQRVLKYVALIFLAYVVSAFLARPDWGEVLRHSFIPHFERGAAYATGAVALLGTTLTSYAYVWETIEIAQEQPPLRRLGMVHADAAIGMIAAGLIFWFIVITTGATLGIHHKTVETAQDAANALLPIAGPYAGIVFGIGLLASAALAVPVLAGTSAYVIAQAFNVRANLNLPFARAPRFYYALLATLVAAVTFAFAGISPIKLLMYSSIAGAFGTPITLIMLMLAARDKKLMGKNQVPMLPTVGGWTVTAIVVIACGIFLWQTIAGGS